MKSYFRRWMIAPSPAQEFIERLLIFVLIATLLWAMAKWIYQAPDWAAKLFGFGMAVFYLRGVWDGDS